MTLDELEQAVDALPQHHAIAAPSATNLCTVYKQLRGFLVLLENVPFLKSRIEALVAVLDATCP